MYLHSSQEWVSSPSPDTLAEKKPPRMSDFAILSASALFIYHLCARKFHGLLIQDTRTERQLYDKIQHSYLKLFPPMVSKLFAVSPHTFACGNLANVELFSRSAERYVIV